MTFSEIIEKYAAEKNARLIVSNSTSIEVEFDDDFSARVTCDIVSDLDRNWSRVWSDVEGETKEAAEAVAFGAEVRYHPQLNVWCEVECEGICAHRVDSLQALLEGQFDICCSGMGSGHVNAKQVRAYAQFDNDIALIVW